MSDIPVNIVLVEDNVDHAQLVIRNLRNFKVPNTVKHIEDGEAAIEYLDEVGNTGKKPHIILLDLRLPKVDGIEVLKYIKSKANLKEIPVVILTTSEAERDVVEAYGYNANSYLVKPVDFSKFAELMETLGYYWMCWNKNPISN
jgi:DNA-binding response OmpR family regulator